MSEQPSTPVSAEVVIAAYEKQIALSEPRTRLAELRAREAVAAETELKARIQLMGAKGHLRQLALEQKVITLEEATSYVQEEKKQPGPDRN